MKQRAAELRSGMMGFLYPLACQTLYNVRVGYDIKHYNNAMLHVLTITYYCGPDVIASEAWRMFRIWYYAIHYT